MELNEQTLEEILTRQREEYQLHLGPFAEHLESQIQAIAEGHATLREEIAEGRAALREEIAESHATLRQEMRAEMANIHLEMEMMRSRTFHHPA